MFIDAGELNKRITISQKIAWRDEDGYRHEELVPVRSCAASFSRVSGKEMIRAGADFSEEKVRFVVRHSYSVAIDRKMVVTYRGEQYEIEYVNDYGDRHEYVELICKRLTKEAK